MGPQITVAIDVGMTCTGVCYAVADQTSQFYMIQRWPGSSGASADKVPTCVCYRNGRFSSWGFETGQEDFSDPLLDVGEWFKVYLDHKEYRDADDNSWPRSYEDVKRAYRDFLGQLYTCIQKELETAVLRGVPWGDSTVEFIFSVPTTWTAISITNTFEQLIRDAGFASGGLNHKITIGLTEAEAAAIHTFATEKETYKDGDIILVVDAGGGTTDLALLKAIKLSNDKQELKQLDVVQGVELGSVEIDIAFEDLVIERLRSAGTELGMAPDAIDKAARKMARKEFRPHKENFGSDMSDRQLMKRIEIPGVSASVNIPHAGIRNGGLMITNDEIRTLFDRQLDRMFQLVDHQMNQMSRVAPNSQISHMVLSGGLGSSEYIKKRLVDRYVTNRATSHRYANNIHIVRSRHPQAAPVQGLLHDRLNKQKTGDSVLKARISRFSLGIVCDQVYDRARHVNQQVTLDPSDGKQYAKGQIAWFILKGQSVSDRPLSHSFYRNWKKQDAREPWKSQIVLCHKNGRPPQSLNDDGVVKLCQMTSDLTRVDLSQFQKHKKHWWQCDSVPTYYSAEYDIRFVIGAAASVNSELWFKNQRYNEPNSFTVAWDAGAAVSAPQEIPGAVVHNYDRFR